MSATSISTPRHVVIIGGGPAGLTAAVELCKRNGPMTVLEKDKLVGGIARTESYKGYHFDIGRPPLLHQDRRGGAVLERDSRP